MPELIADAAWLVLALPVVLFLVAHCVAEWAKPVPDDWDLDTRGDEPKPTRGPKPPLKMS